MKFFSHSQVFNASVAKFSGKMQKFGPSNKKPGVTITLRIPLTPAMMYELPPRIQTLLAAGTEKIQDSLLLGKVEADYQTKVSLRFFSVITGELMIERGFEHGNPMNLKVKKFYNVVSTPCMEVELTGTYDSKIWAWGGTTIGEADLKAEVVPFEGKLEFDESEQEQAEKAQRN